MTRKTPKAELNRSFSSENAAPTEWSEVRSRLEKAEIYWLSTVRPDGQPHVTPLIAVWMDDALCFCTGPTERKAKNLETNTACVLTTGCDALNEGVDVVVEGAAVRVRQEAELQNIADRYLEKYGSDWVFEVRGEEFFHQEGTTVVYRVSPTKVFAFGKGRFSQTRWRF